MPTEMIGHCSVITIQDHILYVGVLILDASDVVKKSKTIRYYISYSTYFLAVVS